MYDLTGTFVNVSKPLTIFHEEVHTCTWRSKAREFIAEIGQQHSIPTAFDKIIAHIENSLAALQYPHYLIYCSVDDVQFRLGTRYHINLIRRVNKETVS